jgi:hypothetical protein
MSSHLPEPGSTANAVRLKQTTINMPDGKHASPAGFRRCDSATVLNSAEATQVEPVRRGKRDETQKRYATHLFAPHTPPQPSTVRAAAMRWSAHLTAEAAAVLSDCHLNHARMQSTLIRQREKEAHSRTDVQIETAHAVWGRKIHH